MIKIYGESVKIKAVTSAAKLDQLGTVAYFRVYLMDQNTFEIATRWLCIKGK